MPTANNNMSQNASFVRQIKLPNVSLQK